MQMVDRMTPLMDNRAYVYTYFARNPARPVIYGLSVNIKFSYKFSYITRIKYNVHKYSY